MEAHRIWYPHRMSSQSTRTVTYRAVSPEDGRELTLTLSGILLRRAPAMGRGRVLELAHSLPNILERPAAIFEGILRDKDDASGTTDGWLCYCGRPNSRFLYDSGDQIPINNRTLMAFVNEDEVIYSVRWEPEDHAAEGLPEDRAGRFRRQRI